MFGPVERPLRRWAAASRTTGRGGGRGGGGGREALTSVVVAGGERGRRARPARALLNAPLGQQPPQVCPKAAYHRETVSR